MRPLSLLFALSIAAFGVTLAAPAEAVPLQLNHQGRLDDAAGVPLEGQHALKVSVFDQAAGGAELWSDTVNASFEAGVYSIILGANGSNPLPDGVFDGRVRYIALAVDDGPELPQRLVLTSVPYAIRAGVAASVAGGVVDASELRIAGTTVIGSDGQVRAPVSYDDLIDVPADADTLGDLSCATGQIAQWNGIDWACADQAPTAVDVSTLNGTVSITNLPVGGGANQVAAGDHAHSFGQITGVAAIGQLPTGTTGTNVALGDHGHNLSDLSGDLPMTRTTGDLPITRTTGDLPLTRTTGDLPITRTTGDLPLTRTTGDLPLARTTGTLPLTRTTGDLDAARLSGVVGMAQLPVGSSASSVSRGDHSHNFNALTGSVAFAQLPTGTTSSTVAIGNHGHAFSAITGSAVLSQLPVGTSSTTVARGDHGHGFAAITGTADIGQLPVGTSSSTVARGDHAHDFAAITGAAAIGQLPVGTSSSTVARGDHTHDAGAIVSGTVAKARLPSDTVYGTCSGVGEYLTWGGSAWVCNSGTLKQEVFRVTTGGYTRSSTGWVNHASGTSGVASIGSAPFAWLTSIGGHWVDGAGRTMQFRMRYTNATSGAIHYIPNASGVNKYVYIDNSRLEELTMQGISTLPAGRYNVQLEVYSPNANPYSWDQSYGHITHSVW